MTDFDRLEPRLPALLADLAAARVPDYVDDMLQKTARTRQRPAWSSFERWLPMDVARPAPFRAPSLRPLVIIAILGILIAASALAFAGSRPRLPAPFGPARNGAILFSTTEGDILAADPATGTTTAVVTGPAHDQDPWVSPDGSRVLFQRVSNQGTALLVANIDGSGLREVLPAGTLGRWIEWSPTGDRIVISGFDNTDPAQLIDVAGRSSTTIDAGFEIKQAVWRPGHEQLVLTGDKAGKHGFWLVNPDGTGLRQIPASPAAINEASLSPDGSLLAYATWEDGPGLQGRIHVVDIDSGRDRLLTRDLSDGYTWLSPQFSPDGRTLLEERYDADGMYSMAILSVDGGQPAAVLGAPHPEGTNGAAAHFSPDGTKILLTYRDDGSTWLLARDGTTQEQVAWPATEMESWQRLAP
jgi:Tol biopolymer transport system component